MFYVIYGATIVAVVAALCAVLSAARCLRSASRLSNITKRVVALELASADTAEMVSNTIDQFKKISGRVSMREVREKKNAERGSASVDAKLTGSAWKQAMRDARPDLIQPGRRILEQEK